MNTFLARFHALRLSSPAMLLILLLQRTPVVQWLLRADAAPPGVFATVLRSAMLATVTGGAVHTLTGATNFTSNPASPASATVGAPFNLVFSVTSSASGTGFYRVTGTLPPGLSIAGMDSSGGVSGSSATISGTPTTAGGYAVSIQAWGPGNSTSSFTNGITYSVAINVAAAVVTGPSITTQPRDLNLPAGYAGSLTVVAGGNAPFTYQWRKDGAPLAGATGASLAFASALLSDSGNYTVVVTNADGTVTSTVARVAVGTSASRFINLSTRGFVGTGANVLIAGLVINGPAPKTVLVRVVGPTLAQLGLSAADVLADPLASVRDAGGNEIYANDDWGTAANASILPQVFHTVGAFDLPAGSKDAVALVTLAPGLYTVIASGKNSGTGIALLETYEVP